MVRDLYAKARAALNGTLNQSEKLGLRALLAQSQSLLDYALQLSGNAKEATGHFAGARRDLAEIKTRRKSAEDVACGETDRRNRQARF